MEVIAMLEFARRENSGIEYLNQRIRRFILGRSLQRPIVDLMALQNSWIFDQIEDIMNGLWSSEGEPEASEPLTQMQ